MEIRKYTGPERRKNCNESCPIPGDLINVREDIASMKTSLSNIEENIRTSGAFKQQVSLAFLGIIITIFAQVASFSYLWGSLSNEVKSDSERIESDRKELDTIKALGSPITRDRLERIEKKVFSDRERA